MESFLSAPLINCFKFYWSTFQKEGVVKKVTDKKEDEVIEEIFTQFLDHALPLSMNSHYLFMDFILEKLHEIKKHPKILKMFGRIKLIGPIDFEKTLMTFNKIRSVCINNPPKSIKEILYFSELIDENSSKNEQPITIDQDKLFYMHLYYLILRIGLFPKNKQEEQLITFLTSQKIDIDHLPRDFDAALNWKIPYLILKLAIRFSMKDTDFKNKMKDFDFKRNLYALMYELRINDQNLKFAKRMIKCNYGDLDIFTE